MRSQAGYNRGSEELRTYCETLGDTPSNNAFQLNTRLSVDESASRFVYQRGLGDARYSVVATLECFGLKA
jgi:hypothetical protein